MKHYLKLVPISTKIHRKQSRMTRICITLAVILVAVMFGLADMYLQGVTQHEIEKSGNWHYAFHAIDSQTASFISARPEVKIPGGIIQFLPKQDILLKNSLLLSARKIKGFLTIYF